MFGIFRKKSKKGELKMTTLEQVRKAYADLSDDDKREFEQSLSDRVHESIAAQERADGDEDTQTAADREHEALGAEHADEERKSKDERYEELERRIFELEKAAKNREKAKEIVDEEEIEKKANDIYGLGNGVFADEKAESKPLSTAEVVRTLRKLGI